MEELTQTTPTDPIPSSSPQLIDELQTWREELLQTLLRLAFGIAMLGLLFSLVSTITGQIPVLIFLAGLLLNSLLGVMAFGPQLPYRLKAGFILLNLYLFSGANFLLFGLSMAGSLYLLAFIFITVIFLGLRPGITALALSLLSMAFFALAFSFGWLSVPLANQDVTGSPAFWLMSAVELAAAGSLVVFALASFMSRLGAKIAQTQQLSQQLQAQKNELEQQSDERNRALLASMEVSRRLSAVVDPQELVMAVVEQIRQSFHYYHTHIYLIDERRENLVMAWGTGEAGRQMLEAGHKIPVGRGLVGRCARSRQVVSIPDVSKAEDWLPNPLLPETKCEAAIPILVADRLLGVLDVQQKVINGFKPADIELLQSLANQAAVALQNTRQYELTHRRAQRQTMINTISQKIQNANSVDEVLQTTAQELGRALNAQSASVQVSIPEDQEARQ